MILWWQRDKNSVPPSILLHWVDWYSCALVGTRHCFLRCAGAAQHQRQTSQGESSAAAPRRPVGVVSARRARGLSKVVRLPRRALTELMGFIDAYVTWHCAGQLLPQVDGCSCALFDTFHRLLPPRLLTWVDWCSRAMVGTRRCCLRCAGGRHQRQTGQGESTCAVEFLPAANSCSISRE